MRLNWFRRNRKEPPQNIRGGRVVAVIHCVLNQNVRDFGAAVYPGYSERVLNVLLQHEVGIFQLPCPEMVCLGLSRTRPKGARIRDMLDTPCGRRCCQSLGRAVAEQFEEHAKYDHRIFGIVGGDRESPGCAVHLSGGEHQGDKGNRLEEASGVFMKALESELLLRGLDVPFLPMRESNHLDYEADIQKLVHSLSR